MLHQVSFLLYLSSPPPLSFKSSTDIKAQISQLEEKSSKQLSHLEEKSLKQLSQLEEKSSKQAEKTSVEISQLAGKISLFNDSYTSLKATTERVIVEVDNLERRR